MQYKQTADKALRTDKPDTDKGRRQTDTQIATSDRHADKALRTDKPDTDKGRRQTDTQIATSDRHADKALRTDKPDTDKGRRRQIRLTVNKDLCRQIRRTANRYTDRRCECGRLRTKKTESRTTLRFSCICIAADQLIFRRSGSWSGEAASISICSLTILTAVAAASSPLLP